MLDKFKVIHGAPTPQRGEKVRDYIESLGVHGVTPIVLTADMLSRGRTGIVDFYSKVEEEMSLRSMKSKRASTAVVIVNDAERFFKQLPGHYKMLFVSMMLSSVVYPELNVKFVFTTNYEGEASTDEAILRELTL